MRLIDADKFGMYLADVQLAYRGWKDDACETLDDVMRALEEMPAVDAMEVVRCKDCKYLYPKDNEPIGYYRYDYKLLLTNLDCFCSEGERREK